MVNGLRHRHGLPQVCKLRRHDAAHGVFRIVEVLVDKPAGVRPGVFQHPLDHVGRQLLQHVHRIVHIQLLHDGRQLLICGGLDDNLLSLRRKVGKHLRRQLLGQCTEGHHGLLLRQLRDALRNIHLILLRQHGPEGMVIPALQQIQQRLYIKFFLHWMFLLFPEMAARKSPNRQRRDGTAEKIRQSCSGDTHLQAALRRPYYNRENQGLRTLRPRK